MTSKETREALLNSSHGAQVVLQQLNTSGQMHNPLDTSFQPDVQATNSDNRPLAILAMNIHTICSMSVLVVFKILKTQHGVSVLDFMLARNVFNLSMAIIGTRYVGINPINDFPQD
jgi:hypothetical protein